MNGDQQIERLLRELGCCADERPSEGLAGRIKSQIPHQLMARSGDRQPISIFIHLKINRLAAAAIIAASLLIFYGLFGGRAQLEGGLAGMLEDLLTWRRSTLSGLTNIYQELLNSGKEVVFFQEHAGKQDPSLILMYWRLPEGDYRVIFSDGRMTRVDAETLIRIQAGMIHRLAR
ncbi:MAG: hypothetical protein QHH07_10285 [Sedimentisphaerales bacterium]|jgi:hypothetical protein|nr:hypothetical protein [Sedimentisphaerales bacterium]